MQFAEISTLLFTPKGAIKRLPFVLGIIGINMSVIASMLLLAFTPLFIMHLFGAQNLLAKGLNHNFSVSMTMSVFLFALVLTTLYVILYGTLLWSHLCLMLKRLRDLKLSVWYVILPYACTMISGSIHVSQILRPNTILQWDMTRVAAMLAGLMFVLILMLWPSQTEN